MLNKKHEDIAYNIIDLTQNNIDESVKEKLAAIEGVFMVRLIQE
jgi:D-3-phosphoglycerate dehydrogenase